MMISFINSLFDYFSGNAVFINKLDIRAWPNPGGKEARGDAIIFINFGWPKLGNALTILALLQLGMCFHICPNVG